MAMAMAMGSSRCIVVCSLVSGGSSSLSVAKNRSMKPFWRGLLLVL